LQWLHLSILTGTYFFLADTEAAAAIPTHILSLTLEHDAKISFEVRFGPELQGKISEFEAQNLTPALVYSY
jgi:hypothetical protein